MSDIIERQNQVIIALLARDAIGAEQIEKIVSGGKKKGDPKNFVKAYNRLDGRTTIKELVKIVGGSAQNMGQVLQAWEEKGIVFKVGTGKNTRYFGLMKLSESNRGRSKFKKPKRTIRANKNLKPEVSQIRDYQAVQVETPSHKSADTNQQA